MKLFLEAIGFSKCSHIFSDSGFDSSSVGAVIGICQVVKGVAGGGLGKFNAVGKRASHKGDFCHGPVQTTFCIHTTKTSGVPQHFKLVTTCT